jgi:LysR family glycine cleavage system transcriptional activator
MPRSRNLPPLNALKAFEASARLGGFVRAARELGVTAAAVSLQVKSLESFYGAELFFRHSNGISLTSAGDVVYRISTEALGSLNSIAERIAGRELAYRRQRAVVPRPNLALRCTDCLPP